MWFADTEGALGNGCYGITTCPYEVDPIARKYKLAMTRSGGVSVTMGKKYIVVGLGQ
ncbi:MAG: hypothetical protein K0R48_1421, partial [Gammaproteobacteria bacterium]|nr:hypothetical protein [Gammaproteobacteria bacterium]